MMRHHLNNTEALASKKEKEEGEETSGPRRARGQEAASPRVSGRNQTANDFAGTCAVRVVRSCRGRA